MSLIEQQGSRSHLVYSGQTYSCGEINKVSKQFMTFAKAKFISHNYFVSYSCCLPIFATAPLWYYPL